MLFVCGSAVLPHIPGFLQMINQYTTNFCIIMRATVSEEIKLPEMSFGFQCVFRRFPAPVSFSHRQKQPPQKENSPGMIPYQTDQPINAAPQLCASTVDLRRAAAIVQHDLAARSMSPSMAASAPASPWTTYRLPPWQLRCVRGQGKLQYRRLRKDQLLNIFQRMKHLYRLREIGGQPESSFALSSFCSTYEPKNLPSIVTLKSWKPK